MYNFPNQILTREQDLAMDWWHRLGIATQKELFKYFINKDYREKPYSADNIVSIYKQLHIGEHVFKMSDL